MSALRLIVQHVNKLAIGEIFATRHLLSLATRAALDQALYRLVKSGFLVRLARGVFCKHVEKLKVPTIETIVRAKASAFGKTIAIHGQNALKALTAFGAKDELIQFAWNAKSSSFVVLGVRVYLVGTSMNRVRAGDTKAGLSLRAMSQINKDSLVPGLIRAMFRRFSQNELRHFKKQTAPLMTGWMSDIVFHSGIPLGYT
ncbi:MAG: hypothetical protein K2X81_17330 [Candidatus Obscuribacterales bacterium]|nr:hypothetical protein [Candidatus Obscuribacterales bacterium]